MNRSRLIDVSDKLKHSGKRLKVAESFTGGGLASSLVSVPGASDYFIEGIVCYSPQSKINRLNVSAKLIEEKGVVSSEVAAAMTQGLLDSGNCDIAIATTGNAGPDADKAGVGTCYLAIAFDQKIRVEEKHYSGDRGMIIDEAIDDCIDMLYKIL